MDKDPVFNFNKISKRYAYVADGDSLVYNFGQSLAGSIAMRCYTDVLETKQYLFEGTDNSNHKLGLYRNNSNKLCIDVNGVTVTTDISMTSYAWHTVAFSFENPTTSESQSTKSLNLRVMVDGAVWTGARTTDFEYGQLKFSIGRKTEGTYTASTFGGYSDVSPFFGQIEMLATRAAYCEQSTINLLIQELTGITRINEVDDFGMLRKTEIHKGGQPVLSNTYVYKTRSDTRYTSHQVRSELIKYGSQIVNRGYTSDSLGNVTAVTDATFGSHNYEYDYRGFLVKEDGVVFQYDANGNVIKKGTVTFGYDSTIKDRLVSVGGTAITYSTANPLNPVTYGSKSYNYEGRRLIKYTSGSIYHNYTYNDRGLRISKKKNDGSTWNYIYDDGKLIYEQGPSGRLDFLYDENGLLYGFIRNNTDKYFYIRDCMQNILAIINENGTIVTKYTYDAWGKITSISGPMSSTVGLLNPFRYKGYYYDTESGMYYCNSRYYVPEWGRWLNADNADYLQLEHCSCVNLFAYCDNNPVMQVDENGRLAISTLLAFGLAALIGAVTSAVSSIISQKMAGEKIKAKQVAVDAVFGAISGVVACTNIGLFGSIIVGAGMAGLQSLLEDEFNGEKPDIDKMRFSMVIGAFAGAIAGGGADVKNNVGRYNCMNGYIKAKHNSRHTNVLYEIKLAAIKDAYRINAVRYVSGVTFTLLVPLGIIKVFEEIIL